MSTRPMTIREARSRPWRTNTVLSPAIVLELLPIARPIRISAGSGLGANRSGDRHRRAASTIQPGRRSSRRSALLTGTRFS
jgi:hypothetical protein